MQYERLGASGSQRDTLPQEAYNVPTLDSLLKFSAEMGLQGIQGASATQRQGMELDARSQEARVARMNALKDQNEKREYDEGQELDFQMGRLNQVVNGYDDYLSNMDPNDPTQAPYAASIMRKRSQLMELMDKARMRGKGAGKGYSSNTLKGILEEGTGTVKPSMMNPEESAKLGRTWDKPENAKPAEKQKAPEEAKKEESDKFHSSQTTISIN